MSPTEQLGELADVPVVLEVEATRRNCRLEELMALRPGVVLPFPSLTRGGVVRIYTGNVLLATAEMCESLGQSAIRITTTDPEGTGHAAR
ncbi:MAG: FliM/FliN family flagellar motor switch protein [Acidobacteria bacterium]|nr:FliM/FliN family flagellar motor switch protein [Acidobacteriota bacterium]